MNRDHEEHGPEGKERAYFDRERHFFRALERED
jgi:hypothetical protein